MSFSVNAASCPAPQMYSGTLNVAGTPPVARVYADGDTIYGSEITELSMRVDMAGRFGGGSYGVLEGLTLSSSGLLVTVAVGHAMIDGYVELISSSTRTITIPDSSPRVWIWLRRDGGLEYKNNVLTAPTQPAILIGSCTTSGGAVSGPFDYSGVVYLTNGSVERNTGDTGAPGDTPPAGWRGWTHTTGGSYWWNGSAYLRAATELQLAELAQDAAASMISAGTGLAASYNDGANTYSVSATDSVGVADKTSNYTLLSTDRGKVITNSGASGDVTITLTSANVGDTFVFAVLAAHNLIIDPGTATIQDAATSGSGDMRSSTVGDVVRLRCVNSTLWLVESKNGSGWAVT